MKGRYRPWIFSGGAIVAVASVVAVTMNDGSELAPKLVAEMTLVETEVENQSSSEPGLAQSKAESSHVANASPTPSAGLAVGYLPDYFAGDPDPDVEGATKSYGQRVRFSEVADCKEKYISTPNEGWVPTQICKNFRLYVDHPYGEYSVEQLEIAAKHTRDADAAYILAERLATEKWRQRSGEAHALYMKAFLLTADSEIYQRMLVDMGVSGQVYRQDGSFDPVEVSINYTMASVGEQFGVIDEAKVESFANAAKELESVNIADLDRQANEIYESLLVAREGL
ncbi:MAG: hypothetical protein AAFO81_04200 [Pseudomonadota bacterium]